MRLRIDEICTCIKSTRVRCNRRIDSSICSTPACRPDVHTFVATKRLSCSRSRTDNSPNTSSDRPYIGEESTSRPPNPANAASTSSSGARSASAAPTSNVCHVPSPITGTASPDDGIARVRIFPAAFPSAPPKPGTAPAAANATEPTPSNRNESRRLINGLLHVFMREGQNPNPSVHFRNRTLAKPKLLQS